MTKKASGKSIIANFGALSSSMPEESSGHKDQEAAAAQRQLPRVGAGIIGATQRSLAEIREERDRLVELVAKGGARDIDPNLIDPSPFPDRLPDDSDADFNAFKKLISEEGQQVPIQVRTHPKEAGRFQVVYGHRRWRAAKDLQRPVKAIVIDLSDGELVIAQGLENSARKDLSWIERSLFAWRMDQQGIRPRDIKAALAIDDAELTRMRQVPRNVPLDIIEAIGRAPKVGRPRWVSLAEAVGKSPDALARVRETLSADKVPISDERFSRALGAATGGVERTDKQKEMELRIPNGPVVGRAVFAERAVRLNIGKEYGEAFSRFLQDEFPRLLERFSNVKDGR